MNEEGSRKSFTKNELKGFKVVRMSLESKAKDLGIDKMTSSFCIDSLQT